MEPKLVDSYTVATSAILQRLRDGEREVIVREIDAFDARLKKLASNYEAAAEVLNGDADLSSDGRLRRLEAVRDELLRRVSGELDARLAELSDEEAKWQTALRNFGAPPADSLAAVRLEMRAREIRHGLADLDEVAVRLLYETCGDDEIRQALRSAPLRRMPGADGRPVMGKWISDGVVEEKLVQGSSLEAGWLKSARKRKVGFTALVDVLLKFAGTRRPPEAVVVA